MKIVFLLPKHNNIQFSITEDERNQNIFTYKKLRSENFHFTC